MLQNNNKQKYLQNLIIIVSFLLLSTFSVIFILHTYILFSGSDLLFHLKRVLELKTSFSHGVLLPQYSFNQFHGSAVMLLYPYINLWPILLFSLFLKSKILLIYIWVIYNVFLSLLISFYSSKPFNKSIWTSYLFAVIYSLSNTYTSYIFYDSDFGVVTALALLPLVVFGFIKLLNGKGIIELSLGLIGIVFSHVLSVFIIIGLLILWTIFNYRKVNIYLIKRIAQAITVVALITSIEWLPTVYFGINNYNNISSIGFPSMKGTSFMSLIHNSIGISYGLSIFAICGLILGVFCYKKFNGCLKQMYIISLIVILICSNLFPWNLTNHGIFKIIKIFQFSWRFYIIPQIFLSYIFAKFIVEYISLRKIKSFLFVISICLLGLCQIHVQQENVNYALPTVNYNFNKYDNSNTKKISNDNINKSLFSSEQVNGFPKDKYKFTRSSQIDQLSKINGNGSLSFEDYYPKEPKYLLKFINNNLIFMPKNKNSMRFKHIGYNAYSFKNRYKNRHITIPIFCYNGEHINLYLNNKLTNFKVNKNSLISLNNVSNGTNFIYVEYKSNRIITIMSMLIFLLGLVMLCKFEYADNRKLME